MGDTYLLHVYQILISACLTHIFRKKETTPDFSNNIAQRQYTTFGKVKYKKLWNLNFSYSINI